MEKERISLLEGGVALEKGNEPKLLTATYRFKRDDGKEIVYTGMHHLGSKEYYEKVEKILEECDTVLYERGYEDEMPKKKEKPIEITICQTYRDEDSLDEMVEAHPEFEKRAENIKKQGLMFQNIFNYKMDKAVETAGRCMLFSLHHKSDMRHQWETLPKKENWVLCDTSHEELKLLKEQGKEKNKEVMREEQMIGYALAALEITLKGTKETITAQDYLNLCGQEWMDALINQKKHDPVATREDKIMREMLKEKLEDERIKKIGIIYGAAHGPGIRERVKSFGFEEVEKTELVVF